MDERRYSQYVFSEDLHIISSVSPSLWQNSYLIASNISVPEKQKLSVNKYTFCVLTGSLIYQLGGSGINEPNPHPLQTIPIKITEIGYITHDGNHQNN